MANPSNVIDFTKKLSDFLNDAVAGGFYSDVIDVEKVDEVGFEAGAVDIKAVYGQVFGNVIDDFIQTVYLQSEGNKIHVPAETVDAATSAVAIVAPLDDGEFVEFVIRVSGHGVANNEVCFRDISAGYFRDSTLTEVFQTPGTLEENNLAGVVIVTALNGNNVEVQVTGIAGKTITWSASVIHMRRTTK